MDLELRHLRYFVVVAEERHFSRAAQRLHMSQPPLSQQIQRLERIVGSQLLVRTSRSVALTPAGLAFLDRARRLLAQADESIEEGPRIGRGEMGTLGTRARHRRSSAGCCEARSTSASCATRRHTPS
ncbi:MAG TPA: LysR family transcriptional regulator [Solirubrobacteraceae bacterium]|jgi:DNA-binding transcriptional LysR family regulator|nr:LysR family transcriptional regulator [Solirubrobacteraceae bacterium]